jgi:hypothetical protein
MATTRTARTALPLTRARWVALLLGVPLCLALIGNTGLSLVGALGKGSFPVSYTYPRGTTTVSASVSGGQVLIQPGPGGQARLTGTAEYSIVRPHLIISNSGTVDSFRYDCVFPYGNCGLDATLSVPPERATLVSTDGGDATVTGMSAQVKLSTGGGDISAYHDSGPLDLHTDGGDITAATRITSTDVTAFSGGGDIKITFTAVPHYVHLTTDGGDITLVLPPNPDGYNVTPHTDGGNVADTVTQNPLSPDTIIVSSGGGDITISPPPAT